MGAPGIAADRSFPSPLGAQRKPKPPKRSASAWTSRMNTSRASFGWCIAARRRLIPVTELERWLEHNAIRAL
jgi:hypothetical protein